MIDPAAPQDQRLDVEPGFALTAAQQMFFESFGFLRLRGLFASEVHAMTAAFDEVFASARARALAESLTATVPGGPQSNDKDRLSRVLAQAPIIDTYEHLNFGGHRSIIPWFLESTPSLGWMRDDPRIVGTVQSLIGPEMEYFGSDGNLFDCDTSWHWDAYNAPIEVFHLKLLFYLDRLDADNGALRVLPGTNHFQDSYPGGLRSGLFNRDDTERTYGVPPDGIPAHTIENEPGDLIVVNFRTMHATFNSGASRRLFTINYRESSPLAPPNPFLGLGG